MITTTNATANIVNITLANVHVGRRVNNPEIWDGETTGDNNYTPMRFFANIKLSDAMKSAIAILSVSKDDSLGFRLDENSPMEHGISHHARYSETYYLKSMVLEDSLYKGVSLPYPVKFKDDPQEKT